MKKKRIALGALLLLLLFLIFGASGQDGAQSGSLSALVTTLANGVLKFLGVSLRLSEHFVRKAAHFTEYTLLGLLLLANLAAWAADIRRHLAWPLFLGLLIPVLDEYSQTFVPGRAGTVQDVLLDFLGVLLGIGLGCLLHFAIRRRRAHP